jgi:NodT family efflux transporter outer membrane factor (OMF) lipoprotein
MNRYRLVMTMAALFLLVTGCAVHRPHTGVVPEGPPVYSRQTAPETAEAFAGRWWEVFGDEQLNALMAEVFAHNLDLAQSFARLRQAEAVIRSTAAAHHPILNLGGQAGRSRIPVGLEEGTANSYRLSLAAGYEIDLWKKFGSRTAAARMDAEATREDIQTLYLSLSAQTAELYFLAVEQRAQIDLTDRTIASFADILNRVENRYREGVVPALDVYQARQNLAAALARRPAFEANLATAEHTLNLLAGRYPGVPRDVQPVRLPPVSAVFPTGLPAQLLTRRPDVQTAFLRVQASDARIAAAIADRFPNINLLGNYGLLRSDMGFATVTGSFWDILISVSQPLWDGGRRRAEVERARAVFEEILARYHQTVLTAFREVEDALVGNRTTEDTILRLEEREEATAAMLRLSLENYLQGLSDYLPVLTAQGLHFEAESQLLAARRQLFSERIGLARALGGDWMKEELVQRLTSEGTAQ